MKLKHNLLVMYGVGSPFVASREQCHISAQTVTDPTSCFTLSMQQSGWKLHRGFSATDKEKIDVRMIDGFTLSTVYC